MTSAGETELLARLRTGDEAAYVELVGLYHRQLVRLAGAFVARPETAEDVAQETWVALLRGLDRFEGRSSLRTWLFGICANRARSIGVREARTVPVDLITPVVDAAQFTPSGAWTSPLTPWPAADARTIDDADLLKAIRAAIEDLPGMQRAVVSMRDVDGLSSREVCDVLSLTEANQRVLLHRGREAIRHTIQGTVMSA